MIKWVEIILEEGFHVGYQRGNRKLGPRALQIPIPIASFDDEIKLGLAQDGEQGFEMVEVLREI